jgi:hypothetical protein
VVNIVLILLSVLRANKKERLMKKLFFLSILFYFCALTFADAQFYLGLKAGINSSTVKLSNEPEGIIDNSTFNDGVSPYLGWQAGMQYGYRINNLEIAWDILFAQKGYHYENNTITTADIRFNYLSLPATTRYYVTDVLYIGAGVETSILLSAKSEDYLGETTDLIESGKDIGLEYSRLDAGLIFEIGGKILDRFGAQVRYIHGVGNVYQDNLAYTDINGEPINQDGKLRNRSLQLSITADLVVID